MRTTPKAFVLQQVLRRDESGGFSPAFDLTPLKAYTNDIVYLFGPGHIDLMPEAVHDAIDVRLDEEGYIPDLDYFVPTGNPGLIGPAHSRMARRGKGVLQLLWDRKYRMYTVFDGRKALWT